MKLKILIHFIVIMSLSITISNAQEKNSINGFYNYSTIIFENPAVKTDDPFAGETITPIRSEREVHTVGVRYNASNKLALVASIPYIEITTDGISTFGPDFTIGSQGLGDLKVRSLYTVYQKEKSKAFIDFGITLPTGSIELQGTTPLGRNQRLPFTLNLGSGTYDLYPKLVYANGKDSWNWGGQLNSIIRLGRNSRNYILGNQYGFHTWVSKKVTQTVSLIARIEGIKFEDIDVLDRSDVFPFALNFLPGGERIDAFFGINFNVKGGLLDGQSFTFEYGKPIYQNWPTPLEVNHRFKAGWQIAF